MRLTGPTLLALLGGCGLFDDFFETVDEPSDTASPVTPTPTTGDTGPDPVDTGATTATNGVFSRPTDAALAKVSLYQGVERPLWVDGRAADSLAPIVAERDALVRVFVEPDAGFAARDLRVVLTRTSFGEGDVRQVRVQRVDGPSTDADRSSTFEFAIDAADFTASTELVVELTEAEEGLPGGGERARTTFESDDDLPGGLPVEEARTLNIVILPFRYALDGSDREPDLSPTVLSGLKEGLEALYPVRDVVLTVGDAVVWGPGDTPVTGTDLDGWRAALIRVQELRREASVPLDTHYYGMIDPADTFAAFCGSICTAGNSYVPLATSAPEFRSSVGLGFTSEPRVALPTMAHEILHALGREHAECGITLPVPPPPTDQDGIDDNYPYADSSIGSWGYDRRSDELVDPDTHTDLMGYCDPTWISDYHFGLAHERLVSVLPSPPGLATTREITTLQVDGDDIVRDVVTTATSGPLGGEPATVVLVDELGEERGTRPAYRIRMSHAPDSAVVLDEPLPEGWTARVLPE